MQKAEHNFRTLWNLMVGHRARYIVALAAMFCGVATLYVTPLITRAAIDGVVAARPASTLSAPVRFLADHRDHWGTGLTLLLLAAAAVFVTATAAGFMSLQGRCSGIASEAIARRLRDRL